MSKPLRIAMFFLGLGLAAFEPPGRAASPLAGKDLFEKRCGGCHSLDGDKEGPRLRGVYGRPAGTVASFHYSEALKSARFTWDDKTLEKWLTEPANVIPDTDMDFRLPRSEERSEIIAYLKQLSK
ncbi:MAG TPA: c-type cytochrome [Bryobacteraceae bacterium]|jgi:cytochrome c